MFHISMNAKKLWILLGLYGKKCVKLTSIGDLFHKNLFFNMYSSEESFIFAMCLEIFFR